MLTTRTPRRRCLDRGVELLVARPGAPPRRAARCRPREPAGSAGRARPAATDRARRSRPAAARPGTRSGRGAQRRRLRVGDVAGERDPPAGVREALLEPLGHREAVEDHPHAAGVLAQHRERLVVGGAGVDHERLADPRAPARSAPRTHGAGRRAGRSRGSSRGRSRRSRRNAGGPPAPRARPGRRRRTRSPRSGGGRSRRTPAGSRSAAASAARHARRRCRPSDPRDARPRTPPRRAPRPAARRASRCVWLSITPLLGNSGGERARRSPRREPCGANAPRAGAAGAPSAVEQPPTLAGMYGVQQHADDAHALGERRERLVERAGRVRIARELPRRALLDVAVEPAHALPDHLERLRDLGAVEQLATSLGQPVELRAPAPGRSRPPARPVAVAHEHRDRPAREVAVLVGELGLVARREPPRSRRAPSPPNGRRASGRSAARRCRSGSITSNGSSTLPSDLLILRPSAPSRKPWTNTCSGTAVRPPSASPARRSCGT